MSEEDRLYETLALNREIICDRNPFLWQGYGYQSSYVNSSTTIRYTNLKGQLHREFGPAFYCKRFKFELWYINGLAHRDNGPSFVHNKLSIWYKEGMRHRDDGPAVVDPAGPKQYYLDGQKYSPKEYKKEVTRRKRKGLIR
jgi:hypothetical protein